MASDQISFHLEGTWFEGCYFYGLQYLNPYKNQIFLELHQHIKGEFLLTWTNDYPEQGEGTLLGNA